MAARILAGLGLEARGVRAVYAERGHDARVVLDIRELAVDGGVQVAICGASGSGKTTLLHMLAGIERPRDGVVRWGAVEVTALTERVADRWRRETLGLVFQQFHLFAGLSALENVLLPLRFDHWSMPAEARARALELLEGVGVRPDGDVGTLSRGELQRVAVARAMLRKPAIVLADEPTASLDRANADAIADLLCAMCRKDGATLIVATHDPLLARRLDRMFDIVDGDLRPQPVDASRPRLASVA
jgi:putative ABC transport system ATP-binding protein